MMITVLGVALLAVGTWAALVLARRDTRPAPASGWFPDPSADLPRRRLWDGRTWTARVAAGDTVADRGRRFRGRFWGPWVGWVLGSVVVMLAGSALYRATGEVQVIAATSFVGMALFCWAFYRFVHRQLALDDVVSPLQVAAVAVATAGAVILVAGNVNSWIIDGAGIRTATATVGFVEEGTKFLVPLALFLLGAYRDPRAGVGLGLASGFGFAITETVQYAYQLPAASGPSFCGGAGVPTDATSVAQAQIARVFLVSPLHWLWTGIAVAIAWRLWHLYGRRGTVGAVGGLLMVMVIHSLNDSSATAFCDDATAAGLAGVVKYALLPAMYLVLRAWARKSTPPSLIAATSRGWSPQHLPTGAPEDVPAGEGEPVARA
ncbi:PrsW family intramembrane metalloprotease [Cellulomonas hominis]|uniref:PrsW family glutamic-type intramembrane protease n=1 Tax=Cellulomonas hominis TaxID=156981 RepID=UPI001C1178AA|nr:PrsW family glutamic-type intramembrane protease [Cellulomonas hominis]MBU5421273.1 PrsW family intramembrane metalloprotease [Cellulomonas hominis]